MSPQFAVHVWLLQRARGLQTQQLLGFSSTPGDVCSPKVRADAGWAALYTLTCEIGDMMDWGADYIFEPLIDMLS